MPAEKLSISLPEDLAARVDALAAVDGVTRSFLIQEAAAQYVASREAGHRDARRRAAVDSALAGFDSIAEQWGQDDRQGIEYLDDVRGELTPSDSSEQPSDD